MLSEEQIKNLLAEKIRVPISAIKIIDSRIDIYSNGVYIGGIPYYQQSGIFTIDTDRSVLSKLDWGKVYQIYKEDINGHIIGNLGSEYDPIFFTSGDFGIVYAKKRQLDPSPVRATCFYVDDNWDVSL